MDLIYTDDFLTAAMALRRHGIGPDVLRIIWEHLESIWDMLTPELLESYDGIASYDEYDDIVVLGISVHEEREEFDDEDEEDLVYYIYEYVCYKLVDFTKRPYFCEDCKDRGRSCPCKDRIPNFHDTGSPDYIQIGTLGLWLERVWDSFMDDRCLFEARDVEWQYVDYMGLGSPGGRQRLQSVIAGDLKSWHDAKELQLRKQVALASRLSILHSAVGGRDDVIDGMRKARTLGDYLDETINNETSLETVLKSKDAVTALCDVMCPEDIISLRMSQVDTVKYHVRSCIEHIVDSISVRCCSGCRKRTAAQACFYGKCGVCCRGCIRHTKRRKYRS